MERVNLSILERSRSREHHSSHRRSGEPAEWGLARVVVHFNYPSQFSGYIENYTAWCLPCAS
jgi:hypothetical protein